MSKKHYYLIIFLNISIIALFMFAIAFSLVSIATYIAHIFKDGYLNLFIGSLIFYIPPFTLSYLKKKLRHKLLKHI